MGPLPTTTSTTKPFTCANCEIEIVGPPTFHVGVAFCCAGCVAGGPCTCTYGDEPSEVARDPRVRHCIDIVGALGRGAAGRDPVPLATTRRR